MKPYIDIYLKTQIGFKKIAFETLKPNNIFISKRKLYLVRGNVICDVTNKNNKVIRVIPLNRKERK